MDAGSAANLADPVIDGLRRHGRDWAETPECAALVARVLHSGSGAEIMAIRRRLRAYRAVEASRRALRRYEAEPAPRQLLRSRALTGRELLAALLSWAERTDGVELEHGRLTVPTPALVRFVAQLGDDPRRVIKAFQVAGLVEGIHGERLDRLGPALVLRIPAGALPDAA